jgi:hypothetical protein
MQIRVLYRRVLQNLSVIMVSKICFFRFSLYSLSLCLLVTFDKANGNVDYRHMCFSLYAEPLIKKSENVFCGEERSFISGSVLAN